MKYHHPGVASKIEAEPTYLKGRVAVFFGESEPFVVMLVHVPVPQQEGSHELGLVLFADQILPVQVFGDTVGYGGKIPFFHV